MVRNKKLLALLMLGFTVLLTVCWLLTRVTPPDEEKVAELLSQMISGDSYRYQLTAQLKVDGVEQEYFSLTGETDGQSSHLTGTVLGTETELYLIDGTLYQMIEGVWSSHPLNMADASTLFAELTPQSAFAMNGFSDYVYLGQIDTDAGKKMQLRMKPNSTGWVAEYFSSPDLLLTLDRRGRVIERITLTAAVKENDIAKLTLTARFFDQGAEIAINAPR